MLGLGDGPAFAGFKNADTDWMRDGKYGIYLKYLNWTPRETTAAEYNQWVDAFDVDRFVETVELTGASWVIWGLGRVWFNSPNATLDGFVGDFTSNRDLPLEIATALQERGIRFMLYAAADKTESENDALGKLALGWGLNNRYTSTYVNNWADVLQVWSDRYAKKVSGWWIDHAYPRYAVSVTARGASNPELAIYREHLLSGNPDGIVAFNHGWQDLNAHTPEEDYRSGHERAIAESVASSRWWHGLQWHYLSRLGPGLWGSEGIRYDTQVLIDYVNENNRHEGANTFSVFVYSQPGESAEGIVKSPGNLSNAQIRQLSALRDASLQFVDDTSEDVSFVGTWERMDDELDFRGSTTGSDETDASAELTFSGIGVEVVVRKGRNGGLVDVELDGDVVLDDFDTYSRTTAFKQIIYTNKNLDAGSHTVRLVATGRKSAAATAADAMLDNFAVTMADTMRPRVLSVTSDASHPTKDSFTVTIDFLEEVTGLRAGEVSVSNGSVSNFAGSGASYTLDIAPTAGLEGEVTVDVPANAVVDGASNGNLQGSETFAVDTRAPVIQTAVANQAVLTLGYGEALDPLSVPPASAFTLTGGGAPRTISNVVVNGSRVVFSIDPPASYGEAGLQVGYSAPSGGALVDALGNKVPSFTNQAVANESPGTTPSTDTWITGATAFSVREGDTAVATLTATEAATAAGDPVWWIPSGAAGGPDGGKFALSGAGALTFAAAKDFEAPDDANADGSYQVTVQLSVGALTASADLTVTLTNRNEAPVADAHAVQPIVAQGATATLSGSGSDPDADDTLTYAWTQTGTPAVALSDTAAASPTFTAPSNLTEDATLSFTLRVADSSGLYHEDAVSVTVQKDPLLTAAFENAPARHDGSTPFAVDLRFSDEVALWYSAFTSGLLTTTGGTVQRASRLVLRSNIGWRIPVTPDGDGEVVITLPANRPCSWLTGACARDGRKLAVAASVTVPGPAPSPAPDITSAAAFTVQEGETAVGTLTATDADTQASGLSWSLSGGADQAKFAITSAGALSFAGAKDYEVPDDANTDGAYQVTVQVSDGGHTDTADLTVTLTNVNEAPTADAGPDQPGVEPGSQVTLGGTGTDPDAGDTLSYAWTQTGGTSVTLTGGATATATFTLPSGAADDDEFTFKLKVADAAGLFAEDSVTVRAVASTDPAATVEVLNEDFDDGDAEGWTVYDGSWAVTDGTYGVSGGGEGKAVATAVDVADFVLEAEVRVQSTSGDSGVVFRVSDPGTGTDNYKGYYVGVATNSSLVFGKANAGQWEELDRENLAFTSGLWYRLKVVASGASIRVYVSDVLTIEATDDTYDSGAIGLRTSRAEADWDNVVVAKILEEDSVGFGVTAEPGEIDEGAATTVTVATVNGATFAEAQDIALEVSGSASAADYEMASTGLTLAAGTAAVSVELTAVDDEAEEAAETVTLTAARGGSAIGSATVTIRASDAAAIVEPAAPEISSASTFSVAEGTTAVATLAATDADTQASDLTWSLSGGADQAKFAITSAGALSLAGAKDYEVPDDANTDGAYQVTVQVSDGGRTDTADLTVTLTNANEAPTAEAGTDQADVAPGSQVTLGGTGTDSDAGDTLSYAWTQTGGTSVTLTGGATATATFAAPDDLPASAELTFRLQVTDAGGLHDDDTVRVTVRAGASTDPAATVEVLNEDFDDGDAEGWTVYDGSWSVTDGTYGVNGGGERKAVAAAIDVADFVLEAEVRVQSTSGDSGVVFRVSDPGTGTDNYKGYYVGVATDSSLVFGKANAGRWDELDRENLAFTSDLWYRLKVVASGASIRVYVSDVLTIEATDDTYDSGAIGLRTWRAEADWDNVVVAKILEEDSVGFRVTAAPGEIDEGAAATVTVATVNGATFAEAQDIALEVSGSASAADYEMASTGLTLAAGTATVSMELTAVDDEAEEAEETVTLTAARGGSAIGSATVTIRASDAAAVVEPAAPEISSASTFSVAEGTTAVATLAATDADTQASGLTWSLSGGADQAKFAITSAGALSFAGAKDYEVPDDANTDGAYQVAVQVSDDGDRTDTADLTVTLTNVNEAPAAEAGTDQADVAPGSQVTLGGTGTDPDAGDTLSYAWTQTGGTSVTLTGGATATATFTLPSGAADDDEFTFKLEVADAAGLSAEDSVRVTVRAVASTDPAVTVELLNEDFDDGDAEGWTVYDGSWSVTDGTYGVSGGGEGKAVATAIDVADFVLEADVRVQSTSGDSGVVFRVSDPGTGTDNYKGYYVGVATNSSLVFGKANEGQWEELDRENLAFTSDLWYRLKVVASGASIRVYVSDVLTIEATDDTYDSGAIGLRTSRAEADWDNVVVAKILEEDSVGFQVTAEPGEIDEGAAATVTVATVNGATFAEAQDIALEVSGSASAADYEMASTGLTLAAGTAAVSVELTAVDDEAEEAAETVTLTAARGGSAIGSATVTIRASDAAAVVEPAAPEISSASTFSVAEGTTAVATLAATDADTEASGLTWSLSGGADQAKFAITSAGALSLAGAKDYEVPDDANTDGAYQVTVQVSDGGRTDTADLTVTLTNVNEAPTAEAGTDQADVAPGSQVTLGGTGTDSDAGDTLSYAWTQTGGTSVTLTGGATATATFAAPDDLPASEELTFRLQVTDAGGLHDDDTVRVTVQASDESSSTESDVEWGERLRDRDIVLPSGSKPTGLWSDGTTLWVLSEWNSGQVLTYSLADGTRLTEGEVTLPDGVTPGSSSFRLTGSGFPAGMWSDGTTLWVADYFGGVRAHRLADGARLETDDLPDDVLAAAGNSAPTGLWSDGEFLWVTDHWQYQVFAYRLSDKARVADEEFELWDGLTPYGGFGLWSDGETALVGPSFYARVLAHSLATGEQQAERTVDLSADGVRRSNGLWSDGETLWVANERHNRIYAYAVPGLRRASARNALRTQSEDLGEPISLREIAALTMESGRRSSPGAEQ